MATAEELLAAARAGELSPIVLVAGDRPLAEPLATRLAASLGELWGTSPVTLRHPGELVAIVDDLRTFSMFAGGKVVVAVETGLLADRDAAADLLAPVREALPWSGGPLELAGRAREAALRLLQVLRLFDADPATETPERALARLPDAALAGGRGKGGKGAAEELRRELAPLLEAAVGAGLRGAGADELTMLGDIVRDGLPERHVLILVESAAAEGHPLAAAIDRRGARIDAGKLEAGKGGAIAGLDRLFAELARETGVKIRKEAAAELARRTLRGSDPRGGAAGAVDADSTERLAAEYRKLATLAGDGSIELERVESQVEDRGEQDVWAILDAIGGGRAGEALAALGRRLSGSEDPIADRLGFFKLLADFARQLVAVDGLVTATGAERSVTSYPRFKERVAPKLQGEVAGLAKNPIAKLHPFRLHRAYLAAGRFGPGDLDRLPAFVLETELRLKGDSGDPDAALADLVVRLGAPRRR